MSNGISGAFQFQVKGVTFTLEYTWDAIAQINEKYADGHSLTNPVHLSDIMSIGLQEHHPGLMPSDVKKFRLPIIRAVEYVTKALNVAYFGEEDAPKDKAENPQIDATPEQ